MNAHVLRKWSLAKNLTLNSLPVLILLVFRCQLIVAVAPFNRLPLANAAYAVNSIDSRYNHISSNRFSNVNAPKFNTMVHTSVASSNDNTIRINEHNDRSHANNAYNGLRLRFDAAPSIYPYAGGVHANSVRNLAIDNHHQQQLQHQQHINQLNANRLNYNNDINKHIDKYSQKSSTHIIYNDPNNKSNRFNNNFLHAYVHNGALNDDGRIVPAMPSAPYNHANEPNPARSFNDPLAGRLLRERQQTAAQHRLLLQQRLKRQRNAMHRNNMAGRQLMRRTQLSGIDAIVNAIAIDSTATKEHAPPNNVVAGQQHQPKERNRRDSPSFNWPSSRSHARTHHHSYTHFNGASPYNASYTMMSTSRQDPLPNTNYYNSDDGVTGHYAMRRRRYCSAHDPTTLAFEAPIAFEGKVRSMSSDRRRNFSVTFEVKEIFKRKGVLKLPSMIRLKFTYKNASECDIYREVFRSVGHLRDELEQGKLYILFVNQVDLFNFTILGQPVKRTRKSVTDVRIGADENYGE